MKTSLPVDIICGLFTVLFFYTGVMKFIDHDNFVYDLGRDPMIGLGLAKFMSMALPITEIIVGAIILIPKTQRIGILSAIGLMCCFTIYVGWMLHNPTRHCTCGGVLRQMSWNQHLYFNIAFTILSFLALYLYQTQGTRRSAPVPQL